MENIVSGKIKSVKQIPGFTNISGFSSFIGYLGTDANKTLISKWEKASAFKKRMRLIAIGAAATVFMLMYLYNKRPLTGVLLAAAALGMTYLITFLTANREKKARTDYFEDRRQYGIIISDFVSSMLRADYYNFLNGELFIYSQKFCSVIWVDNGNMVTYQKENIKSVNLEQIKRPGQAPRSTTYATGSKNITSQIKSDFAWQLDIFSNLPEYPKITLMFREDEQVIAKQLKTILKPKKN
jgi:hypothetical protein